MCCFQIVLAPLPCLITPPLCNTNAIHVLLCGCDKFECSRNPSLSLHIPAKTDGYSEVRFLLSLICIIFILFISITDHPLTRITLYPYHPPHHGCASSSQPTSQEVGEGGGSTSAILVIPFSPGK